MSAEQFGGGVTGGTKHAQAEPSSDTATGGAAVVGLTSSSTPQLPATTTAPSVTVPKGGGAVRGIGEKFSANPATGTAGVSIPLPLSPGRSGFTPGMALSYDSGAGQGPFGLGWNLGLPSVSRRTDKGVPRYDQTDVFLLSGAEDLVPLPWPGDGTKPGRRTVGDTEYAVDRYRPRVEGLYARIERWTSADGEVHWRSISRDNVTTLYGTDDESRIADPDDPSRVFSWLISSSRDDKGNAVEYAYLREDSSGVDQAAAHEQHRNSAQRSANRYLSAVRYGNRASHLTNSTLPADTWMFELVFDYGGHDESRPTPTPSRPWYGRQDPYSSYRSGFEIRSYRLCRRVLMFHHFPGQAEVGRNCLVKSLSLSYRSQPGSSADEPGEPRGTVLESAAVMGHRRVGADDVTTALPPLEFEYSEAGLSDSVQTLDGDSLENLPYGLDAGGFMLADLDGESIAGVLTDLGGAWGYKPAIGGGRFDPLRTVPTAPSMQLSDSTTQLLDLAGDGNLDIANFDGPLAGFFERTANDGWAEHRAFSSLPALDWSDPNLRMVDLNGDGHADILITEGDALVWHPSLGEQGFGPAYRIALPTQESNGPRVMFADPVHAVFLADLSGDGLTDLVRIRNGEVCYWPSLGYGRFGAQVVMDDAPVFDRADVFDARRIRLSDVDGTGPTDLIYLAGDRVDVYLNRMGNGWEPRHMLAAFPPVDDVTEVTVADILGKGTACLVWSSPLPGDAGRQIRYVDLMGVKPHLLTRIRNNLGAETVIRYTTSTTCYLADKAAGQPWVTRLPFPVHVVDAVETYDHINRSRFVSRYRYHHGRFDGVEREFCGFAMVEQRDTEQYAALVGSAVLPVGDNVDAASHVPPVLTRSWFHTGAHLDGQRISTFLAETYYPPPASPEPAAAAWRLDDSVLVGVTTLDGEREACRALKGRPLRQEVYALDGTTDQRHPYTVVEHSYTVRQIQPAGPARHGVFAVDPRESITASCERDPGDARVAHELVLEVDDVGNVTHAAAITYRRSIGPASRDVDLPARTAAVQATTLLTETRVAVTGGIDRSVDDDRRQTPADQDAYRTAVPYDLTTFQVSGAAIDRAVARLGYDDVARLLRPSGSPVVDASLRRRLVTRQRMGFGADDDPHRGLPFGELGALGLVHESYSLVMPDVFAAEVYGSRVSAADLRAAGYVAADGGWWAPSGTVRYAPSGVTGTDAVSDHARRHFFLPRRFVDPFAAAAGADYGTTVEYDADDLLPVETVDAAGNLSTAGERSASDALIRVRVDYRVLGPTMVTDPNRNRTAIAYDALGRVAALAVMGKPEDDTGDRITSTTPDLDASVVTAFRADPREQARGLLGSATTRFVYDADAFLRTKGGGSPQPAWAAAVVRERHMATGHATSIPLQVSFSYSDGVGREIQSKLPAREFTSPTPSWTASGWVVFDNKGRPVRQYEPFFTGTHEFEFAVTVGVSPILCYDPIGRVVATVHPNHTYDKVIYGPWRQTSWDANDTVAVADPAADLDVGSRLRLLPAGDLTPTWHERRVRGDLGPAEQQAGVRTARHAGTPSVVAFDPLGRAVLTVGWNRTPADGAEAERDGWHRTYVELDVAGHQLAVLDCPDDRVGTVPTTADRLVARYRNDLAGRRLLDESMEAGYQGTLYDIAGQPVVVWRPLRTPDSRQPDGEERVATTFDKLRRPVDTVLSVGTRTWVIERRAYGDSGPDGATHNARGRIRELVDPSGMVVSTYDTEGNLTQTTRTYAADYRDTLDWNSSVRMEPATWTTRAGFDALARPEWERHPDGTVVHFGYDRSGRLTTITGDLPGQPPGQEFVRGIRYDAHGRRTSIAYGNDVTTTYDYEPDTFRLARIHTARRTPRSAESPAPPDTRRDIQDLRYTYDPVGNITSIADMAQPRVFHLNTVVDASTDYRYDALYRLVEASGREHLGSTAGGGLRAPQPASWNDLPRVNPTDRNALGRYTERYVYDHAGNLTLLRHRGSSPANPGWRREFRHEAPSQIVPATPGVTSNQLTSSITGVGSTAQTEVYAYDTHGNMTVLPPLQTITWNFQDQLVTTSRQVVTTGPSEQTHYSYDGSGQRVRKVTRGQQPSTSARRAERLYVGGFEIYREFDGNGRVTLSRTSVHIMDGQNRLALIETRTDGTGNKPLVRYQLTNHLGSATGELDDVGEWISYEEYYPYGSTALAFIRNGVPPKRYRYTTRERDEESGLSYHGARYYAHWLSRWVSPDPAGLDAGANAYAISFANPARFSDPNGMAPGDSNALGARNEDLWRIFQDATNELRAAKNSSGGRVEVWYQEGAGGGSRSVIPDEQLLSREGFSLTREHKALHVSSESNLSSSMRRTAVRESLDQALEQLRAVKAQGTNAPNARATVVRTLFDSDSGARSEKVLKEWTQEAKAWRQQWIDEAGSAAGRAERATVRHVTTTAERLTRATQATEGASPGKGPMTVGRGTELRAAALPSALILYDAWRMAVDKTIAEQPHGVTPGILQDELGQYFPEWTEGTFFDRYSKRYVTGPQAGTTVRLGIVDSYRERSKVRDEWGYFSWFTGSFVEGRVPPIVVSLPSHYPGI